MKISNTTGAVYGSPETPKKVDATQKIDEAISEAQKSANKVDSYKNETKTIKEAVFFDGAVATVSFRSFNGDGIVNIGFTKENIDRLKERFGDDVKDSGNNSCNLSGKAEKYIGAFWEYCKEKQPDTDSDGYMSFEEFKKSKSLLIGYDEINEAPVTAEISSSLTEEALKETGVDFSEKISVDQGFNDLIMFDKNIDGVIAKNELSELMANEMGSSASDLKNSAMLRWILWIAEGMQDEKEKKKNQAGQMDTENLRRMIAEGVENLPNIKNDGKLAELLQNLKTSLK